MNIAKAYEMLIAAQASPARRTVAPEAAASGAPWLSAGIYGLVSHIGNLVERFGSHSARR